MSHGEDKHCTWQELEQQGDKDWEASFWAETIKESDRLRSEASGHYKRALARALAQERKTLAAARLCRKVARFYRKSKQVTTDARNQLEKGLEIIDDLPRTLASRLENERLRLEIAFCDFNDGKLEAGLRRAEAIIKACRRRSLDGQPGAWSILGAAYNLLGIALNELKSASCPLCPTPEDCWDEAENCYGFAEDFEGTREKHDLTLNRALRLLYRGNYEAAIEKTKEVLDKLTLERAVLGQHNLALAYLERGDIKEAVSLAGKSCAQAKKIGDIPGQIRAREVLLKTMKKQISVSDSPEERANLLTKADRLCHQGLGFIDSLKRGRESEENSAARLELHRVMAEIYLAADDIQEADQMGQEARKKLESSVSDRRVLGDEKWDLEVTLALIEQRKGNFDHALEKLGEASDYFFRTGERGKVIQIDIERAGILIQKGDRIRAKQVLQKVRGLAIGLNRQRDVDRIDYLKERCDRSPPPTQAITWLHLSDLHFRQENAYDANIVLRALLRDVAERIQQDDLRPDFIVVSGDVAFASRPEEYDMAQQFLDDLLKTTGLGKDHLLLVPGNHDVDRKAISTLAAGATSILNNRRAVNRFLANDADRSLILHRFHNYRDFVNHYLGPHLPFDDESYFYVKHIKVAGRSVAILGLNSAWLCASDEDRAKGLLIGERQTRAVLKQAEDADLKIALLHHPFDWLHEFDQNDSAAMLLDNCDFLLHGHLHQTAMTQLISPDSGAMLIAGGACYETRQYPNMYNFIRLDLAVGTGTVYLRRYSDARGGFWAKDTLTYRNVPNGAYTFSLRNRLTSPGSEL